MTIYIKSTESNSKTGISRIQLLASERAALANTIYLPTELSELVYDREMTIDPALKEFPDITDGMFHTPNNKKPFAVSWLNAPSYCRKMFAKGTPLRLILRTPRHISDNPFDFPRALISLKFNIEFPKLDEIPF